MSEPIKVPAAEILLVVVGNDLTHLYVTPEGGRSNRLTFTPKESKILIEVLKDITRKNLATFNSRFGKDGAGLGALGIKGLEDK